ncbi:hypothetical protein M2480_001527 [Parabacteroides sp. PFB2-12]|nr:hypothetical protein [Parabacteroides sp. PM6-13]MDH6390552.1 hypothetical protein [Parabacteroides sp. PFB2-12]
MEKGLLERVVLFCYHFVSFFEHKKNSHPREKKFSCG